MCDVNHFLFNLHMFVRMYGYYLVKYMYILILLNLSIMYVRHFNIYVCVEVLRPCQPNGVMSSAVSLPNHTFTGQA